MRGHGFQWISNKINIPHPGQLKKWKSWEPFWSYQLNSTANLAHLPQDWPYRQCCLAGSSKTTPRILFFSIAMGAEYLTDVKSIATFALKFFGYIILVLASVISDWFLVAILVPFFQQDRSIYRSTYYSLET